MLLILNWYHEDWEEKKLLDIIENMPRGFSVERFYCIIHELTKKCTQFVDPNFNRNRVQIPRVFTPISFISKRQQVKYPCNVVVDQFFTSVFEIVVPIASERS